MTLRAVKPSVGCAGFLPERTHGLSHRTGAFPSARAIQESGAGMETNEEMALTSTAKSLPPMA